MLPNKSLSFIINNVKGIQSSKRRLKSIQYFKAKIGSTGVLFLQKTHPNSKTKTKMERGLLRSSFIFSGKNKFLWCPNCLLWERNFFSQKKETDKEGRVLILNVSINDSEYILINLFNANTEKDQIDVLNNTSVLLEKFDKIQKNQLIMTGDFNLFFDLKLDAQGGNPTIKKKTLAKLIELKENYDLRDIWRVRNTKSKRFTFV